MLQGRSFIQQAFNFIGRKVFKRRKKNIYFNQFKKNILVYVKLSSIYGRTKRQDELKIANIGITLISRQMAVSNLGQALASTGEI